jgi:hypothetical protein
MLLNVTLPTEKTVPHSAKKTKRDLRISNVPSPLLSKYIPTVTADHLDTAILIAPMKPDERSVWELNGRNRPASHVGGRSESIEIPPRLTLKASFLNHFRLLILSSLIVRVSTISLK